MKIFSIRNVLAVAAVYGASQYAKKHGGWRNATQGLLDKVREAANQRPGVIADASGMGERSVGAATGTVAGVGAAGASSSAGIGSRSVGAGSRDQTSSGVGRGASTGGTGSTGSGPGTSGSTGDGGRRS